MNKNYKYKKIEEVTPNAINKSVSLGVLSNKISFLIITTNAISKCQSIVKSTFINSVLTIAITIKVNNPSVKIVLIEAKSKSTLFKCKRDNFMT